MVWSWYGLFSIFFRLVARAFGRAHNVPAETLYDRLEKRHYPEGKVKQNVEAMSSGVRREEAEESTGRSSITVADACFVSCLRQKFSRAVSTKSERHVAPGSQCSSQMLQTGCVGKMLFNVFHE